MADTIDLGSIAPACRFKSCHPHQNKTLRNDAVALFLSVSFFVPAVVIVARPDAPDTVAASASFPIKAEMQKCLWFVIFPKKPLTNQIKSATMKINKNPRETGKIYLRKGKTERVNALTERSIFMKMRKVISTVLAGVLALSALPISAMSASAAEGAYAPGDVDMDGFVTAHDAAVVSRALYVDNNLLTSEQKKLADVNGDGKITQEDADWIHENQVYNLGQLDESSDHLDSTGIFYQFYYVARKGAGVPFEVVDKSEKLPENLLGSSLGKDLDNSKMPQLFFNLLDVDGDGNVTLDDASASLFSCAMMGAGLQKDVYLAEGRYDLNEELVTIVCNADKSGDLSKTWAGFKEITVD